MAKANVLEGVAEEQPKGKWVPEHFAFHGAQLQSVWEDENGNQTTERDSKQIPGMGLPFRDKKEIAKQLSTNPWLKEFAETLIDVMTSQPEVDLTEATAFSEKVAVSVTEMKARKA
jgi:hypothetical protein